MSSLESASRYYRRLLRFAVPYRRQFGYSILGLSIVAATEPALPALLQVLLDDGFIGGDSDIRYLVPLAMVVLFAVRGCASYVGAIALHWVAQRVVLDLRVQLFSHLLALPAETFLEHSRGAMVSKLTFDTAQVADGSTRALIVLIKDSLALVALIAFLLYLNWPLALLLLLTAPLIARSIRVVGRRLRDLSQRLQGSMGDLTQVSQEAIQGHLEVKLFGAQAYETERFGKVANEARQVQMKNHIAAAANVPIIQLLVAVGMAIATYVALLQGAAGALSAGEFAAFMSAAVLLLAPTKRLTAVNQQLQRTLAASQSVFSVLDADSESDTGTRTLSEPRGEVEFVDVTLRYDANTEPALQAVNVYVPAGSTLAIVGPSGAGKTSMVGLLPRFYAPSDGAVTLDGVDIAELRLAELRKAIAMVSQDVLLFNDSIRNNIAYGAGRAVSDTEVRAAAEAAQVMQFVRDLPDGLDSVVGDAGQRLSGGQRQRIAIARALLKDAPLLVLDEATSALDSASEHRVQEALAALCRDRTVLVIAHRLATVEHADQILVLDHGRVVGVGTHTELLRGNPLYQSLHARQFASAGAA